MLEILIKLFGKAYINRIIGTGTNVSKPIKLDKNSPFKLYADSAFDNPKTLNFIEEKIMEYGPFALSNKNATEVKNFEMNARRLLRARNKKAGVEPKVEAEVFDIGTKKKVDDKGIMALKSELGLPEGVQPGSVMAKAIKERADIKRGNDDLSKAIDAFFGGMKNQSEVFNEGRRRPIIRQILAEEDVIKKNLTTDEYDDLLLGADLDKGADPNKDPFKYLDKYFVRDDDQLDMLDTIIDEMPGSTPAEISAEFKKRTGGLKVKKQPIQRESLDDEAVEVSETSELPDPDDEIPFAKGGRVNYSTGTKLRIAKFLKDKGKTLVTEVKKAINDIIPSGDSKYDADVAVDNMLEDLGVDRDMFEDKDIDNLYGIVYSSLVGESVSKGLASFLTKKGKGKIKMADEVVVPDEVQTKRELRQLADEDPMNFVKTVTPKFFERMELKIKYPGITDDLIEKIMIDDNPQRKAEVLATLDEAFKMGEKGMDADAILNVLKNTPRTKQADGGLNYLMGM